jgi:hypothetical protein
MGTDRKITEIFSDIMFEIGSRIGKDGHLLFPIARPCYPGELIIIRRLFSTSNNRPLYWIDNMSKLPMMYESGVESEVINHIAGGILWKKMK